MPAETSDVSKNKTIAIVSYFLFFIPLLSANKSKFAMFHANQSLILLLISVAASILSGIIPVVGSIIGGVVSIGVFILWVMGIISASNGEVKPLPVIGEYKILKA
jgi:uncharacterized membrane protein